MVYPMSVFLLTPDYNFFKNVFYPICDSAKRNDMEERKKTFVKRIWNFKQFNNMLDCQFMFFFTKMEKRDGEI